MSSTVFVIGADNALFALKRTPYDSEDLFQRLLGDHPALLEQVAGPDGKLLLVQREAPVPEAMEGSGRWSLDHLFLDRSGVPVLVEVKRASDTRIRREVVAQMLDYAANGVVYWPLEQIIAAQRSTAETAGDDPDMRLAAFLGDASADEFWRQVESNLRSGRVRMVFVADQVPKELRRIVEFLNEQMRPAEVLALEVEQHATPEGLRMLTPRLVGKTERAESTKAVQSNAPLGSVEDWFLDLEAKRDADTASLARKTFGWFVENGFQTGRTKAGVWTGLTTSSGKMAYLFFLAEGTIWLDLYHLQAHAPFADEAPRKRLLHMLRALPNAGVKSENPQGFPSIAWQKLAADDIWTGLTGIAGKLKQAIETQSDEPLSS